MNNKLFLVCPFSCMEPFLQKTFGNDIFFLTCSAAILQQNEVEYISEVKYFIQRERIQTIYIVNDTSCRIINGAIKQNQLFGLPSEEEIRELYVEHYFSDFKDQSLFNQQNKLAELNIIKQANAILNPGFLGNYILQFDIEIKGLLTSKKEKLFKEIRIENQFSKIHEL